MASNDLFRSFVGAAFPLFSTGSSVIYIVDIPTTDPSTSYLAFFHNLGVGPALSIIGGVGVAMLPIPFIL